jgi:type VI secretion system protein ImpL
VQAFFRSITSRWVLTAFGVASGGVMLWLFGPFMSLLEGWLPRVLAILALTFVWMAVNLAIEISRRRVDARHRAGITETPAGAASATASSSASGAEDVAEQRARLTRALHLLRQARGTRGYLYEQPWYAIIGPPGSGKTTALANAGLRFPLAAELDGGEIRGVGGTRFCDWSFTDEAVLIDTAGRYTTQDSNAATDKAGWDGFLHLLRRTRPRQPLNGAIVAISATDLAQAPEPERRAHARAIRARIKELYTQLAARIPIYVVFTKLDLIQGFTDFFDDLDRERRAQVWGTTFPLQTDHVGPAGSFLGEFRALTAQLSARVIDRLQAERSPERRTAIADFPVQFASLEAPLAAFVDEAFTGTRIEPAPFLRGIYFASGTQEGSPIDRLTGTLARSFGIDQRRAASLRPTQGRGYFLETLLKRVVFGEAMLVVRNPRAARRRLLLRGTAWGLTGLAIVGSVGLLWFTSRDVASREQRFDTALAAYRQAAEATKLSPVPIGASDLPRVKPLLDQARALRTAAVDPAHVEIGLGLAQREKLTAAADMVYRRALENILLPRLVSGLESRMRNRAGDLDYLYRATRVYLILCGRGPMDRAMVREWVQMDWAETYGGASLVPFRAELLNHLDALLARPITTFLVPDPDLLARAQAKLANISVADRAYTLLRSSEAALGPRPFIPADVIGALAGEHFVRPSGRTLQDPIPGIFTVAGFQTVILPGMPRATEQAIRESWVLGQASQIDPNDVVARQHVEHDVVARYAKEYQAAWDGLLNDLEVVPPADSSAAVTDFSLLTSPQGPIKLLLTAMVKQFNLSTPLVAKEDSTAAKPALAVDPSIKALEDHYRDLREFVEHGQIDVVLGSVDRLQKQIADQVAANASGGGPALTPGIDAAQALKKTAASAPQPVARWLQTLAQRGGAVRDDASRQQAAAAYGGPGGALPLCQDVVQRFPFRSTAKDDVAIASFAELFAPNGRIDGFYSQFVRPFVDSTPKDWKLRDPANTQAPVTADGVAQFQRALAIRDTFFGFGGNQPQVHFALRPVSLDSGASQVTLDFGGITASWKPVGAGSAQIFDWPGPTHMTSVGATFDPPGDGAALQQTGPWALFRFLKEVKLEKHGGGESYTVTLRQGDRQAQFDLSAASAHSPFDADLLGRFKCPALRP